jgi:hypothetical protein
MLTTFTWAVLIDKIWCGCPCIHVVIGHTSTDSQGVFYQGRMSIVVEDRYGYIILKIDRGYIYTVLDGDDQHLEKQKTMHGVNSYQSSVQSWN